MLIVMIAIIFLVGIVNITKGLNRHILDYQCADCNVIIIGIDSLRADHLGIYGYNRPTSPTIDNFAKKGIIFMKNYSQSITTTPSFMSIITSLYPTDHGVLTTARDWRNQPYVKINENITTLPQLLKQNGYKTKALISSVSMPYEVGFGRGFDEFSVDPTANQRVNLLGWIKKNRNNKFFVFYHDMNVHAPYDSSEKFKKMFATTVLSKPLHFKETEGSKVRAFFSNIDPKNTQDIAYLTDLYDAAVRDVDSFFDKLLNELQSQKILDKTIIIFVSDHGEEFQDHGVFLHLQFYNEIMHTPLIILSPTLNKHIEIDQNTRSIDIMPTIIDLLGINTTIPMRGLSLLPIIMDPTADKHLPVISIMGVDKSIIDNGYKFIDQRTMQISLDKPKSQELFNLKSDPTEKENLIENKSEIANKLIDTYLKEVEPKNFAKEPSPITISEQEKILQQLKSLGY